ncbi:hypothetical protein L484_008326 [Morus notabilis]|uniref:Uncharacterized protein n=1 Tax=Morus notabilis TaxID=981085 RepID=W9S7Y9_9ROSA|nr:hypothetical protein L484_008326 [Morus notabilis]
MNNEQSESSKNDKQEDKTTKADADQEKIKNASNDTYSRWSPLMDDIEALEHTTTNENRENANKKFDAFIDEVLYGTKTTQWPIFQEFCPDDCRGPVDSESRCVGS